MQLAAATKCNLRFAELLTQNLHSSSVLGVAVGRGRWGALSAYQPQSLPHTALRKEHLAKCLRLGQVSQHGNLSLEILSAGLGKGTKL